MRHYRLYHLNRSGHFARVSELECANDEEALTRSRDLILTPFGGELWQAGQRVGMIGVRENKSASA